MPEGGWFSYSAVGQGPADPIDDAYSRFTNQERFKPLHDWALEKVAYLQSEHDVTLEEGFGMDDELERAPLSRPTVRLTPLQESCAPVTIAFTDSPGLEVRVGHWVTEGFPTCHCDACDEMPEEEFERLTELLDDVVAGRFRESMRLQRDGSGWSSHEFWNDDRPRSGGSLESRGKAARILDGKAEVVVEWMPWQPRVSDISAGHLGRG
ncbi:MAG: DUF6226 family protein [Chloroflexota bacterium]|nr:DUF6226 family protein [Chloroflexota bacterium]MDE2685081.1 DUF6226 family protein [Chloroflexota bacterium]